MSKKTILELRTLMNTGQGDPVYNEPIISPEDYNNRQRPSLVKWLATYGWEIKEFFDALDYSIEYDGVWNPDTKTYENR